MAGPVYPNKPDLDCSPLPELNWETHALLKRYLDSITAEAHAEDASVTAPVDLINYPPIPSNDELQQLHENLNSAKSILIQRQRRLNHNIDVLKKWLPADGSGEQTESEAGSSSAAPHARSKDSGVKSALDKAKATERKGSSATEEQMAERNEAKLRKIKLKVPVMDSAERAEKSPPPSQLQSDAGLSDFKKRKREKDDDDGSDHDEKQRRTSNIQSKSKPVSQRGIAPKAKPKPSKKSAAHKNNKLKKRHSTVGGETATPTPEPEDRSTEPAVEGDYTKTKTVQNQIPIQQFWGFVDQFFRPVNEADLAFLDNEGDEVAPYSIPPLGRPYKEQWAEEDSKGGSQSNGILMAANGQTQDGEICYKPISERIISSLMENRIIGGVFAPVAEETVDEPLTPESMGDAIDLEDRMRKELRFLGLIEDEEDNATPDEHDEITTELRHRQRELREQVHRNRSRRRQMKAIATRFMAWQEYNGVLDDINKSIEQAYIKRFTPAKTKGKKKVSKGDYRPMTENVMQLLHNRQRIIKELGALLPPSQFTIPETSIFTA